jgi:hypothetical protein
MSVTVDHETLRAEEMGLRTVGQVLAHLKKVNRLVVHVLIDGREPDLGRLGDVRKSDLKNHTVFIETAEPKQMARGILDEVEAQLGEADRLRGEAADLLQRNNNVKAMEKLSGCFSTWQHAQQSLVGTAQLLKIDLTAIKVGGQSLADMVTQFAGQLKEIKSALENRDFVTLGDLLNYETIQTSNQWRAAIVAMRKLVG